MGLKTLAEKASHAYTDDMNTLRKRFALLLLCVGLLVQPVLAEVIKPRVTPIPQGVGAVPVAPLDILAAERPVFRSRELDRINRIDSALTAAVQSAVLTVISPQEGFKVESRGSSARLTHDNANPDYDLTVHLPKAWTSRETVDNFFHKRLPELREVLRNAVKKELTTLYDGQKLKVRISENLIPLTDPATVPLSRETSYLPESQSSRAEGVGMLPIKVFYSSGQLLAKAQVTFSNRPDFTNSYPAHFKEQLDRVRAAGGEKAVKQMLSDIRLAKRFFKEIVGAYKFYDGGPSGVGIEQMVLQAGSFDQMMEKLHGATFDENGRLREAKEAARQWIVSNPFTQPANFLGFLSAPVWQSLGDITRKYLDAKTAGQPITFADLRRQNTPTPALKPVPALAKESIPASAPATTDAGSLTMEMLNKFTLTGPRPAERGEAFLYAQGAKTLPKGLEDSWRGFSPKLSAASQGFSLYRTQLVRRNGQILGRIPVLDRQGRKGMRTVPIPEALAQGVVGDSLVEVACQGQNVKALRPIGTYPQDMMIGRVEQGPKGLVLKGLLNFEGKTLSLYSPLPLAEGIPVKAGNIIQAFVKPSPAGFKAVPLMNLGKELTPEIAAREIALRHGARGYFEEAVIRQAEKLGRTQDPAADFAKIKARMNGKRKIEDLSSKAFITIDPVGAGDLDDAYFVEKNTDGSYTWTLATAYVAQYVPPGTPAFKAAARIGNTFYSMDKDGVSEYPMNHPVVSKNVASLLAGKSSLAMISKMHFDKDGKFLPDGSDVFLGLVRVQGRYTYDQVAQFWKGEKNHGIAHLEQITLARELAGKLDRQDSARGKLKLTLKQIVHNVEQGRWRTKRVDEDPIISESHRLIEELKVYGNQLIATQLEKITKEFQVPHISRIHPEQTEKADERLRLKLELLGVPWRKGTLPQYLLALHNRRDLSVELKDIAQVLALTSRRTAIDAVEDAAGHEGLALDPGKYDHPSAGLRRFKDMYNLALLDAYLTGGDPRAVYQAALADFKELGFSNLAEFVSHLNGRQQATKQMDHEVDDFMDIYELAQPENKGKTFRGFVRFTRNGEDPFAVIQLRGPDVTVTVRGEKAKSLLLLEEMEVTVNSVQLQNLYVDATIHRIAKPKNK